MASSNYIKTIRQKVGHDPIFMPTGACIVINKNTNQILLQRRNDNGCWAIHGGAMELGEMAEETMCRELEEETGLKALNYWLFKVYSGPDFHFIYPNCDEVYMIDHIFIVDQYTDTLTADPKEVKELKWFNLKDIPWDNLMSTNQVILKDFLNTDIMQKEVE